ncbi:MAG: hypothetical protein LBU34_09050 [Planctomycetaceae bacterium]|nr:hypothetical protein [Planctomycetaceae bacterium]
MDINPPRCGGLVYIALSGHRTSRLPPTQPFGEGLSPNDCLPFVLLCFFFVGRCPTLGY